MTKNKAMNYRERFQTNPATIRKCLESYEKNGLLGKRDNYLQYSHCYADSSNKSKKLDQSYDSFWINDIDRAQCNRINGIYYKGSCEII